MKKIKAINLVLFIGAAILACAAAFYTQAAWAEGAQSSTSVSGSTSIDRAIGYFAAAFSVGISCIGAGIAVSHVGSAAMGALSEKPELTGRALIFVGLAEGIAIYGLIVAIMILGKLG